MECCFATTSGDHPSLQLLWRSPLVSSLLCAQVGGSCHQVKHPLLGHNCLRSQDSSMMAWIVKTACMRTCQGFVLIPCQSLVNFSLFLPITSSPGQMLASRGLFILLLSFFIVANPLVQVRGEDNHLAYTSLILPPSPKWRPIHQGIECGNLEILEILDTRLLLKHGEER